MCRRITRSRARNTAATSGCGRIVNIMQGETEKEAREFYNYYVHEKGDWEAAGNVIER